MLDVPVGGGLLNNFINFNLSTYISKTLLKNAIKKDKGNATPNNTINENYKTNS
jgi:hypothetical protein